MFHDSESSTAVLENLEASTRVARIFREPDEERVPYPGLCGNCEVRETCLYRSGEKVTWYCEEYK